MKNNFKKIKTVLKNILTGFLMFLLVFSGTSLVLPTEKVEAANTKIRQEINIMDSYLTAASGSYATSSEIILLDPSKYSGATYYFEVVASTTSATNATISLVNATSSATTKSITANGTSYARYRSTSFTAPSMATEYKVVLGNEATRKGIIAARIIILQDTASLAATQTQIEIGNYETYTSTATSTFSSPKYWYYDSSRWDGSPTFYAEVTYQTIKGFASSTSYSTQGTFVMGIPQGTASTSVALWGGGGAGAGTTANTVGGYGGGGGGAFARSVFGGLSGNHTLVIGSVATGGTSNPAGSGVDTTWDTTVVVADGGTGANTTTKGTGGTTENSTGDIEFAGGDGGNGGGVSQGSGAGGGGAGCGGAGGNGGNGSAGPTAGTAGTAGASTGSGCWDLVSGGGGSGAAGRNAENDGLAGTAPGGGGGGAYLPDATNHSGGNGSFGKATITSYVGTTTIALQEDNGNFGSWTDKAYIVTANSGSSATSTRVRSSAFTPTSGRNYRIAFKNGHSQAIFAIYNAKIIVDQFTEGQVAQETQNATCDVTGSGGANESCGQSFTTDSNSWSLTAVQIFITTDIGFPGDDLTLTVYSDSGFTNSLGSKTLIGGFEINPAQFNSFTFDSPISLSPSTTYYIGVSRTGARDASNYRRIRFANTDLYSGGSYYSQSSGSWSGGSSFDATFRLDYDLTQFTKLEPQYLLANTGSFGGATGLKDYDTLFDPAEWSTNNTYYHEANGASGGTGDVKLQSDPNGTPADITGSDITNVIEREQSSALTMPGASATIDVNVTGTGTLNASRIVVQVSTAALAPVILQLHYRWRNDDGGEVGASYLQSEDNAVPASFDINLGARKRLRFLVSNTTGTAAATNYTYTLEQASSTCSTWYSVPTSSSGSPKGWVMDLSSNVANFASTTDLSGVSNPASGSFTAGYVLTSSNPTGNQTLSTSEFTELEYSIRSTSLAETGLLYCFRLTNAGSTENFTYSQQPQITLSSFNRGGGGNPFENGGTGALITGGGIGGGFGSETGGSGSQQSGGGQGGGGGSVEGAFSARFGIEHEELISSLFEAAKSLNEMLKVFLTRQ